MLFFNLFSFTFSVFLSMSRLNYLLGGVGGGEKGCIERHIVVVASQVIESSDVSLLAWERMLNFGSLLCKSV